MQSMWKEYLRVSLRDPFFWFVLVIGAVVLFVWRAEAKRTRALAEFASSRGFQFGRILNPEPLRLSKADFFSSRDRVKNAISGSMNGTQFILFEQRANRGKYKSFTRTIVAFEVDPSVTIRPTILGGYGLQMEKTSNHVFVWQATQRVPPNELEPFLISALRNFQQAIR
jgi:hypothetical protein